MVRRVRVTTLSSHHFDILPLVLLTAPAPAPALVIHSPSVTLGSLVWVAGHHGQVGAGLEEGRRDERALAAGDLGSPRLPLPLSLALTELPLEPGQRRLTSQAGQALAVENIRRLRAGGVRRLQQTLSAHQTGNGAARSVCLSVNRL